MLPLQFSIKGDIWGWHISNVVQNRVNNYVRQKSGLNKATLEQCWGMLVAMLAYKMAGGVIKVPAAYTSQMCAACGFTDRLNRDGRGFLCLLCHHRAHADRNAAVNIKDAGARKL